MIDFQTRVDELAAKASVQPITVGKDIKGMCAGYAVEGNDVQFNPSIAVRYPVEYDKTIIHEVAHCVDFQRNGDRFSTNGKLIHHDKVFYAICRELGDPAPSREHDYDVKPSRKFREFKYKCDKGCEHVVKTTTHNRIIKKGYVYAYQDCGGNVDKTTFVEEVK